MDFVELNRLLEHSIQRNPLPALLGGVTLGALLAVLAIQMARAVAARRPLPSTGWGEGAWDQHQTKGPEFENELLGDKLSHQEGQISALKEQITELSSVCERVTTENFDLRGELKREKKTRRQVQSAAQRYSEQLDRIAQSDGKLWLNSPNGHSVQFLPLRAWNEITFRT